MYHESIGLVPPEGFVYLDQNGLIQDKAAVPIIVHIAHNFVDGRINYDRTVAKIVSGLINPSPSETLLTVDVYNSWGTSPSNPLDPE